MARTVTQAPEYPIRTKAAVAAAAVLSLWGALQFYQFETDLQKQSADPYKVGIQGERLQELRTGIPQNAILGYLSDAPAGSLVDSTMYDAALYALAPRLLQRDATHDRALGNFSKPTDYAAIGREHGLVVERDFGNGVVLFRKEGAK